MKYCQLLRYNTTIGFESPQYIDCGDSFPIRIPSIKAMKTGPITIVNM